MWGWKTPDKSRESKGQCLFVSQVWHRCLHNILSLDHAFGELFLCLIPANLVGGGGDLGIQIFLFWESLGVVSLMRSQGGPFTFNVTFFPHILYSPSEAGLCPNQTLRWPLWPPVCASLDGVESQEQFHSSFLKHMLFFNDLEDLFEMWKQHSILLCKKVFHRCQLQGYCLGGTVNSKKDMLKP